MAHMKAYKIDGAVGMLRHDERHRDDGVISRKNESIDPDRTDLNYNLAPVRSGTLRQHIERYCAEHGVRLSVRKDLNVMVSWVITQPKDVRPDESKQFFEETYRFLTNRYGESNVLTAAVHLDETTPHLHFGFIPVAKDKNNQLTVSSKLVCTRADLRSFHADLSDHMGRAFGRDIAIQTGQTTEDGVLVDELKRRSMLKEAEEAAGKALEAAQAVLRAQDDLKALEARTAPLKAEYEAYSAFLDEINAPAEEFEDVKANKGLRGQVKSYTVPAELWDRLTAERKNLAAERRARQQWRQEMEKTAETDLARENAMLAADNQRLRDKNAELSRNSHSAELYGLRQENQRLRERVAVLQGNRPSRGRGK